MTLHILDRLAITRGSNEREREMNGIKQLLEWQLSG